MNLPHIKMQRKQSGVVLFISLILLVVLTMLGITTMRVTALEEKMSVNNQEAHRAFQAAESTIQLTLDETDIYDSNAVNLPHNYNIRDGLDTGISSTSYITAGKEAPPGFSMGAEFAAHYFHMDTEGTSQGGGRSDHGQGFYVIGPAVN